MDDVLQVVGAFIVGLLFVALIVFLIVWPVMLVIGYISTFLPFVPALGFWQTWAVLFVTNAMTGGISQSSKS
jgi:hypothetical protein